MLRVKTAVNCWQGRVNSNNHIMAATITSWRLHLKGTSIDIIVSIQLQQGSPTWCPRAPGRPHRPCGSPAVLFWQYHKHDQCLHIDEYLIFIDNMIEDKLSKFLLLKCVHQTGSPSHESVPRSSSQFQKGWWPLSYNLLLHLVGAMC